jgi:hypothetical protein
MATRLRPRQPASWACCRPAWTLPAPSCSWPGCSPSPAGRACHPGWPRRRCGAWLIRVVRTRGSRRHRLAGVDHSRPGRLGGRVRRRRPAQPGPVSPGKLPPGYSIPATATDAEWVAVSFALAPLGKPDVFGRRPDGHDCPWPPGPPLADAAHYTVTRWQEGTRAPDNSLLWRGDLILIPGAHGSLKPAHPTPQHVVRYIGHGYLIEAHIPATSSRSCVTGLSADHRHAPHHLIANMTTAHDDGLTSRGGAGRRGFLCWAPPAIALLWCTLARSGLSPGILLRRR